MVVCHPHASSQCWRRMGVGFNRVVPVKEYGALQIIKINRCEGKGEERRGEEMLT